MVKEAKYNIIHFLEKERKERYKSAQEVLKRLVQILVSKYGVDKIILVGSCLDEDRFHAHSDIDLCIEGLSSERYFEALGELMLEACEFDVDLILTEDLPRNKKEILQEGKILYEKR